MLTDRPNIVFCDYRPKRAPKRHKQPELLCGRIIEIKPRKRDHSHIPVGVPDDRQRSILIQEYLAKLES